VKNNSFDVAIIGGGPAGSACAISLANKGLRVALIDKASFPRDKVCGDALNIDVINQLKLMGENIFNDFDNIPQKTASYGMKIYSTKASFAMPLYHNKVKSCGYVMKRFDFDNFLFQQAKLCNNIFCFENTCVEKIEQTEEGISFMAGNTLFTTKILVGADGAHSIVAKTFGLHKVDKNNYSAGLRQYYKNVTGFNSDNMIELHFFKETAPGYFWMFPMPDGIANVGIGMLSSKIAKNKINIKELMHQLITTHPSLVERFTNAQPLETVKGYGLPLGGKKRKLSGNRFLLVGDAASLIDPFSGEGIGNAVRSGRIAADHIIHCFKENNFSAVFNKAYDKIIYQKMEKEFRLSKLLLRIAQWPRFCNFIIKKASEVSYIGNQLTEGLGSLHKRGKLFRQPSFYLRLFFSKRD
jgi:menaquinone-9 beta-reductase